MPDTMSRERYERIRRCGGTLDLTPGSESDLILTLERTHSQYVANPDYLVLAQFELLPSYRFHRVVTGAAALEVAASYSNGRVAAPGSAGTLVVGDAIKARYSEAVVVTLEPAECVTLYRGGQGQHMIEGIGDKKALFGLCYIRSNAIRTASRSGAIRIGAAAARSAAWGSFKPVPVLTTTTVSSRLIVPASTRANSPAKVAAQAGSVNNPVV